MPRTQALSFAIRTRPPVIHRLSHRPSLVLFAHLQRQLLRSPSASRSTRTFAHRSALQVLTRPTLIRPTLPFLHPSSPRTKAHRSFLTWYLSDERKKRWRQTLRWQLRFHAYLWPALLCVGLFLTGIRHVELEQMYPTPKEWGFWTRWYLRSGMYDHEKCENKGGGVSGWLTVGRWYEQVLERCEKELRLKSKASSTAKEEVRAAGSEGILVEGVGELGGQDVSGMSEPWRRGYYQALMGCAKCAEHLDGMARVKGDYSGDAVSWESVIGPDNPRPKPLPWDKKGRHKNPPRVEDVEDAFKQPEVFYMKILTDRGFSDRQRLDAALAYADYLDFKGLWATAGDMYDWAVDIAAGGLPYGANNVIDMQTGVINKGKEDFASENILRASTAMGVHCARKGDVKSALPIFLSVLRARKGLPPTPADVEKQTARTRKQKAQEQQGGLLAWPLAVSRFLSEKPYPDPPPSGNERPYHTLEEACEEVGLMTYIGEILFATSDHEREKGLSWTRDSVGAAEAVLWIMDERGQDTGKERCRQCLETGLENWKMMTNHMVRAAKQNVTNAQSNTGWLGLGIGTGTALRKAQNHLAEWEEEDAQVELRKQKTASLVHPLGKPSARGAFFQA